MTVACDISSYQPLVNDSYPHRWLIFRACDGGYLDPHAGANLAWCRHAIAAGRLDGYTVYVVYRPGMNTAVIGNLDALGVPPAANVMIDAESWQGQIVGDHSADLNSLAGRLTARQASAGRVWGYGNRSDLATIWPHRPPSLGVVVASYGGSKPVGIANIIGWQYTDGQYAVAGLPSATPPFGPCDHNQLYLPTQGDPPVTPAEIQAVAAAVWSMQFTHRDAKGNPDSSPHTMAEWITNNGKAISALPPPPSTSAIVAAVISALPPAVSLTAAQIDAVAAAVAAKMPAGNLAYEGTVQLSPKA